MSSVTESIQFSNISATTAASKVKGGKYAALVHATSYGTAVQLQMLANDGATWVPVGVNFTVDGMQNLDLPPGQSRARPASISISQAFHTEEGTMGGLVKSGNVIHDANCLAAEVVRQNAVAGNPTQATVNAAEIQYHRSVLVSAKANGCGVEASLSALKLLGVNS
jgi:hypothetical protein